MTKWNLIDQIETPLKFYQFIDEGIIANILRELGTNELIAAARVFSDLDKASNKREAINRALTHLESAHESFHSYLVKEEYHFIKHSINPTKIMDIFDLDFWTCCLTAICHSYLGNGKDLVEDFLESARCALETIVRDGKDSNLLDEAQCIFGLAMFANPLFYLHMFGVIRKYPPMTADEFERFKNILFECNYR